MIFQFHSGKYSLAIIILLIILSIATIANDTFIACNLLSAYKYYSNKTESFDNFKGLKYALLLELILMLGDGLIIAVLTGNYVLGIFVFIIIGLLWIFLLVAYLKLKNLLDLAMNLKNDKFPKIPNYLIFIRLFSFVSTILMLFGSGYNLLTAIFTTNFSSMTNISGIFSPIDGIITAESIYSSVHNIISCITSLIFNLLYLKLMFRYNSEVKILNLSKSQKKRSKQKQ